MARIIFLLLFFSSCSSQQYLTGTLERKSWSKTMQSYCASGSEYWVLKDSFNAETILEIKSTTLTKKLDELEGREVFITGKYITVLRETANNNTDTVKAQLPISQRPVSVSLNAPNNNNIHSDNVSCTLFQVRDVSTKKENK